MERASHVEALAAAKRTLAQITELEAMIAGAPGEAEQKRAEATTLRRRIAEATVRARLGERDAMQELPSLRKKIDMLEGEVREVELVAETASDSIASALAGMPGGVLQETAREALEPMCQKLEAEAKQLLGPLRKFAAEASRVLRLGAELGVDVHKFRSSWAVDVLGERVEFDFSAAQAPIGFEQIRETLAALADAEGRQQERLLAQRRAARGAA